MQWIIIGIILSYLIGSIPSAYIFGRLVKGVDIRKCGSGNVGATNAFRVLGRGWGVAVFLIDCLKGLLPVIFLASLLIQKNPPVSDILLRIILGMACVCGHNWTVFLRFKGGKGIATSLGFLLGLGFSVKSFLYVIILSILIWVLVFLFSRIVSLSSIIVSLFLPLLAIIFGQPQEIVILTVILSMLSLLRHKSNISRLLRGQEHSFRKS